MELEISVAADRPDLHEALAEWESPWPDFMTHDPIGNMFYALSDLFAEYHLIAQDSTKRVVAQAFSVPFELSDGELPVDGWDGAIGRGLRTKLEGGTPNTVSAIEISIRKDLQGGGLSHRMLAAMRANAARL